MNALTEQQRQHQLALRAALIRRLIPVWRLMNPDALEQAFPLWLTAVVPLVADARTASAGLAAAYLREMRKAAGIDGPAPVQIASAMPVEQVTTSLRVTSLVAIRTAIGSGQTLRQAMQTGFVTSSGAASRIALDGGRQTITQSVRNDPHAKGWARVASRRACDFCDMLAGRGAVYGEASADFQAHDHCACTAEPVYSAAA